MSADRVPLRARLLGGLAWRLAGSWYFARWGLSPAECDRMPWGFLLLRFVRGWELHPAPARRYARELARLGIEYNADPPPARPRQRQRAKRKATARRVRRTLWGPVGALLGALLAWNM